jgi:homoserine kinase type II
VAGNGAARAAASHRGAAGAHGRRARLQTELAATAAYAALPRGPIHGDLFRDNVLFDGRALVGVFDFYFAGVDALLFDIAVALNDWCVDLESGRLNDGRAEALVDAYETVRPLESAEMRLLPALLRAAAFRFWVSRAADLHLPREALMLVPHDPARFERLLVERREAPWHPEHHRRSADLPPDTEAGRLA